MNNHGQNAYSRETDEQIIALSLLYNQFVDYEKIFSQIETYIETYDRHPELPKDQLVGMISSLVRDRKTDDIIRRNQLERKKL